MSTVSVEQVKAMIMDTLNLHEEYTSDQIDASAPLFGEQGLGLDSLDALQLAVAIEEKFNVTVDESIGETVFRSIQTITDHVNASR